MKQPDIELQIGDRPNVAVEHLAIAVQPDELAVVVHLVMDEALNSAQRLPFKQAM